jgi:hypothetical protein
VNGSTYNAKVAGLRTVPALTASQTQKRVLAILESAFNTLVHLMDLTTEDTVTYANLSTRTTAIRFQMEAMARKIGVEISRGVSDTTFKVVDLYETYADSVVAGSGLPAAVLRGAFDAVPLQAMQAVLNRMYGDGFTFSDRVWRISSAATAGVKDIVGSGVASGESAVKMAARLKQYLVDPSVGPAWTTGIIPSVSGRGTVNYQALRLARTEINNSYREAAVQANAANPIVLGVKWNLSNTHTVPDVCDAWAQYDGWGLGAGVYPANAAPIDHPNGKCFLTEKLRPVSQWLEPKPEFGDPVAPPASLFGNLLKGADKAFAHGMTVAGDRVAA